MCAVKSEIAGRCTENMAAVCSRSLCKVSLNHKKGSMGGPFHIDDGVSNIGFGCLLIGACLVDIIIPLQVDASC